MKKQRIQMIVEVDLDDVPGTFHTPESHVEVLQSTLTQMYPHYNPKVYIPDYDKDNEGQLIIYTGVFDERSFV